MRDGTGRAGDDLCGNGDEPEDLDDFQGWVSWQRRVTAKAKEVTDLRRLPYRTYLKSSHWRATRRRALQRMPYCQLCEGADRLDVHHLTYQRLGREAEDDLVVLCHLCHAWIHADPHRETVLRCVNLPRARIIIQSDADAAAWANALEPQEPPHGP